MILIYLVEYGDEGMVHDFTLKCLLFYYEKWREK
jgi:hypothetical protein